MKKSSLLDARPAQRCLYGLFLMVIGAGYLMALVYLYQTHQNLDGKPGLSVLDIADSYYGNRSGTRLEKMIRGSMSGHLSKAQAQTVITWIYDGASQAGFDKAVAPIVGKQCVLCHNSAGPRLPGLPGLTRYDDILAMVQVDEGMSLQSLVRLSHIHLFGISLILLGVGSIFIKVQMREGWKAFWISLPFFAVLVDILSWFLTKADPVYAWVVVLAGAVLGVGLGVQLLVSLAQLCLPGWYQKIMRSKR